MELCFTCSCFSKLNYAIRSSFCALDSVQDTHSMCKEITDQGTRQGFKWRRISACACTHQPAGAGLWQPGAADRQQSDDISAWSEGRLDTGLGVLGSQPPSCSRQAPFIPIRAHHLQSTSIPMRLVIPFMWCAQHSDSLLHVH